MKRSITFILSVIVLISLLMSQGGASASPIPPAESQEKTGRSGSQTAGFWESAERSSAVSLTDRAQSSRYLPPPRGSRQIQAG